MVFSVDPGRGATRGDHLKLPVVKNSFLDVSIVQILVHRRGLLGFWLISSPMRDNRECATKTRPVRAQIFIHGSTNAAAGGRTWTIHDVFKLL